MPIRVNLKTRIRFNGQEYDSVEAMPPEARAVYERALASMRGAPGQPLVAKSVTTKVIFNGREYASPEEMPPEVRAQYDKIMGQFDADHNGVPDVLEGAILPTGAVLVSQAEPPTDPAGTGNDAASAWMENLARRQTQAPAPVQSPASFPVVSGESSGSRRLVIATAALLVLLAGVIVIGLLLWSQMGLR